MPIHARLVVLVLAPCAGLTTTLLSTSPLVITVDDLLPPATVCALRRTLTEEADLAPTGDYQEDVFAAGAEEIEDARLRAIVQRAGVEATVPDASALEAFLSAYTSTPSRFASDDVLAAAAVIKRREAKAAWDSEAGRRLLSLNPGFETAAHRRAMPDATRRALAHTVVPRVLSDRARWTVQDATVVRYAAGESQVPHVDPSDATLLVYLSDEGADCGGGGTLFPLEGIRVAPRRGRGVLFFSRDPPPPGGIAEDAELATDPRALHFGERVDHGEKLVAQLMLRAEVRAPIASWLEALIAQPSLASASG